MSGSVFSETLQQITDTKLDELSKRRAAFEADKDATLSSISSETDPIRRLILLSNGLKRSFAIRQDKHGRVQTGGSKHPSLEIQLKNLDRFLAQARHDPSVSAKTVADWEGGLLRHLEVQSLKYQYASLCGQLVTEWLSASHDVVSWKDAQHANPTGLESFENVGSTAQLASKERWESTAFEPAKVNVDSLRGYLDDLFGISPSGQGIGSNEKWQAVQKIRQDVAAFEAHLALPDQIGEGSLRLTIQGLLSSDLLTNEKREVLKDFLGNPVILSEIADVLNLRFAALESWTWGPNGVTAEQRRKISGIFSVHMHEDILQAIFLQYIGVQWSVFLKEALTTFRKTKGAWANLFKEIPGPQKRRLEFYLGPVHYHRSLQRERQKIYNSDYFVAKLINQADQVTVAVEGEVEAEISGRQCKNISHRRAAESYVPSTTHGGAAGPIHDVVDATQARYSNVEPCQAYQDAATSARKTPMQLKQQVVHLLSTEVAINTRLHGELTAFHAVFEDWESLFPHETICTALNFFGVSQRWLDFFTRFLQAPLRFADEDAAPTKVRRRGIPTSHVLSDFLGETVLFCLDLAVTQAAGGRPLWRYHDDLWFWSPDHDTAVVAWKAVQDFARVTGTCINHAKTGTVRVPRQEDAAPLDIDEALPGGDIRWGFLVLSPRTGRFEIDQHMVDAHMGELRKQLAGKDSVFGFIQAWNALAGKFFSSNFGTCANCFGRQHVDDMLATHRRVQQHIFSSSAAAASTSSSSTSSSITGHLGSVIRQRFGVADMPDGYFYFPVELGGLGLQSPFVPLLQVRDAVLESHDGLFQAMAEAEREAYARLEARFASGAVGVRGRDRHGQPEQPHDREHFLSAAEWAAAREDLGIISDSQAPTDVLWVFRQLMAQPAEESVDECHGLAAALAELRPGGKAIKRQWWDMDASWRWITAMYGPEIVRRFGGLSIVDPGLLPMGMVGLLREKRVDWQG